MKKIACFILLSSYLLVLTSLQAQSVSVKGTVRDAKTGEVLPLVNVGLMRVSDTVFVRGNATDFDGKFVIKDVKPGKYLLQASYVGYEKYLEELEVLGNLDKLEIALKGGTTLETVKIVAEKPLYVMDGEKNMYNTKEDVSIQTGTASDALQNAEIIYNRRGVGYFVEPKAGDRIRKMHRQEFLNDELPYFVQRMNMLGFTWEDLIEESKK